MGLKIPNQAYGLLASGISDTDTTIPLQTGHGARFGTFVAGDYIFATLINASNQLEVVLITAISGDNLTVTRGQDGTTPLAYSAGDRIEARPCKGVIEDLLSKITAIWTTGDVKVTLKNAADTGWVMMDDGTIGNAASGATTRANADTEDLFTLLWNNVIDTWCAVSGGRGASAAADFAANKTIALPKVLGRALAVSGTGASLTARALAQILGAETHTLAAGEVPAHAHAGSSATVGTLTAQSAGAHDHNHLVSNTGSPGGQAPVNEGGGGSTLSTASAGAHTHNVTGSINLNIASHGGGGAHNNMQPSAFLNVMIKL